jgi:hypothetical protein
MRIIIHTINIGNFGKHVEKGNTGAFWWKYKMVLSLRNSLQFLKILDKSTMWFCDSFLCIFLKELKVGTQVFIELY